jgi:hypothetical protein
VTDEFSLDLLRSRPLYTCPCCKRDVDLGSCTAMLLNDTRVCLMCRLNWQNSPEHIRLKAIFSSLLAEWVERERCEQLNAVEVKPT